MALSPKNNWEKHLPDLPSYKNYIQLDDVVISGDGDDYCKKSIESTDEVDKKFCNKIAENLSRLKNENDVEKRKYNCYYFNHWLFDNIMKKYYNGNAQGERVNVSEKLFDFVSLPNSVYLSIPLCKGNIFGKPEEWKEEKDLHDYFENHKDIKCNDSDKSKCENYVNYVTYIKILYEKKKEDCCEDVWFEDSCQSYFKCEDKYSPQNLLTKLERELQLLEKTTKEGGAKETLQVEKSEKPGEKKAGQEKTKQEIAAAGASYRKGEDDAAEKPLTKESGTAQPGATTPAKHVEAKLAETTHAAAESEREKPAAAKPVGEKPKETVSDEESTNKKAPEEEANEEKTAEVIVTETSTLQHEENLIPPQIESFEHGSHATSSHNTEAASNVVPLTIADSPNTIGASHSKLDSNFFRNVIMAIAVLGTIVFLIYYNRSSRLESSSHKKKRNKGKMFEHNYYEEYEKELAMYDSEETFLDSEADRLYLNYHAEQESYY